MGAGRDRPVARPRPRIARPVRGRARRRHRAQARAQPRPPGGRGHPDGRAGRRGRVHRRARAPARAPRGARDCRRCRCVRAPSIAPGASSASSSTSSLDGAPLVALRLYPEYEAMQRSRGVQAPTPDGPLLSGSLAARSCPIAVRRSPVASSPCISSSSVASSSRGCSLLLRGDRDGAKAMRDAVAGIERATAQPNTRAFWWTVDAFLDAIVAKGLDPGLGVKQLAARIDLQMRRVAEGSTKVADRLRREVLYYVAVSAPVAPSVREVQTRVQARRADPVGRRAVGRRAASQPILRQARDQLGVAKDTWLKLTPGRAENLPKLKQALDRSAAGRRRDRQSRAHQADGVARRAARQDAAVGCRSRSRSRWSTRRRCCSPKARSTILRA